MPMRLVLALLLAVVLRLQLAECNLQIWTDADFVPNLKTHGKAIVKFYAPWCGHCKRLAPVWEQLANQVDPNHGAVVKVDCDGKGKKICDAYKVQGYPTIMFIEYKGEGLPDQNQVHDYSGARTLDALENFVVEHGAPPYTTVNAADVEGLEPHDTKTIYLLYTASSKTAAFKTLVDLIMKGGYKGSVVVKVFHPSSFPKDTKEGTLKAYRAKNMITVREPAILTEHNPSNYKQFLESSLHGKVGVRKVANDKTFKRPVFTVVLSSDIQNDPSTFKMARNRLFPVATAHPDITFAVASMGDVDQEVGRLGYENLDASKIPYYLIEEDGDLFRPDMPHSNNNLDAIADPIQTFIADYKANKLSPHIKSEPKPVNNNPAEPFIVVGSTFKEVVMNSDKDVVIALTAPWCGHCKNLKPVWEDLAKRFESESQLVVAQMDATANDIPVPAYVPTAFPTIMYAKSGQKSAPIKHTGPRTLETLEQFVAKHRTFDASVGDEL